MYFLGILELKNYSYPKCILVFFHSDFRSVSGFHNISVRPHFQIKGPLPNHVIWNKSGRLNFGKSCCIFPGDFLEIWTSSNFGQIGPLTTELAAVERLKISYRLIMGKCCLRASLFGTIFDQIIIKLAGNQDRHKSVDEFDFGSDQTTLFGVTCPWMPKILHFRTWMSLRPVG